MYPICQSAIGLKPISLEISKVAYIIQEILNLFNRLDFEFKKKYDIIKEQICQ